MSACFGNSEAASVERGNRFTGDTISTGESALCAANAVVADATTPTSIVTPAGASLTGMTSIVIVFGVASRSTPPLAVPPLSCAWKVNAA
jgi:hypothetical protein